MDASTGLPNGLFLFSKYRGEKQHVVPLTHHPEPHAQVLDVELLQPCLHSCKRRVSKYGGRSAARCFYSSERGTVASVGWASIGRLSGARRQIGDRWRQTTITQWWIKGLRPVWRLSFGFHPMFDHLSTDFGVPLMHEKSAGCQSTVTRWLTDSHPMLYRSPNSQNHRPTKEIL